MNKYLNNKKIIVITVIAILLSCVAPVSSSVASAAYRRDIKEAQTIMTNLGIPTGPIDGYYGPQTARGLCLFRTIVGKTPSRRDLDKDLLKTIRKYKNKSLDSIKAPTKSGQKSYVLIQETCQGLLYVKNNRYKKVLKVSTGKNSTPTPNGNYRLGNTRLGWSCSTLYPDGCTNNYGIGKYAKGRGRTRGNMYNKRHVTGAIYIHGSRSVPTYPASHGCIRVTPVDADWLSMYIPSGVRVLVQGSY